MSNYITMDEVFQHSYIMIPKELFFNEKYKDLSNNSRVLYAFLLDRLQLSIANGWHDNLNRVYLIFTRERLAEAVGISVRQVSREMKLLREVGLIEEKVNGLNKPNWIYIKKIDYQVTEEKDPLMSELKRLREFKKRQMEIWGEV